MRALEFSGKWVLVTGASSGLGWEMAQQLAREQRANLVVVARRQENLQKLKTEREREAGVKVDVITADLSRIYEAERVVRESLERHEIVAAILNAGLTYFGNHRELEWNKLE